MFLTSEHLGLNQKSSIPREKTANRLLTIFVVGWSTAEEMEQRPKSNFVCCSTFIWVKILYSCIVAYHYPVAYRHYNLDPHEDLPSEVFYFHFTAATAAVFCNIIFWNRKPLSYYVLWGANIVIIGLFLAALYWDIEAGPIVVGTNNAEKDPVDNRAYRFVFCSEIVGNLVSIAVVVLINVLIASALEFLSDIDGWEAPDTRRVHMAVVDGRAVERRATNAVVVFDLHGSQHDHTYVPDPSLTPIPESGPETEGFRPRGRSSSIRPDSHLWKDSDAAKRKISAKW